MKRFLLSVVSAVALAASARADGPVVRLAVQPMAAPRPALKYLLLPGVREMRSGNPAYEYVRCFAEQRGYFFGKESVDERNRVLTAPLADLAKKATEKVSVGPLKLVDAAACMGTLDWQSVRDVPTDGIDLLLPELGSFRALAEVQLTRLRLDVAGRRFDDALRDTRTLFAFCRHLGEHPAGAGNQLGLAGASRTADILEEMVQQPGCPNLYWALTDLPDPLVELHKGIQGDAVAVDTELRVIRSDEPMTEDQIEAVVGRLAGRAAFIREQAGRAPRSFRSHLKASGDNTDAVRAARDRLVAAGTPADRLAKFSPMQIVLLDAKRAYETRSDAVTKLYRLPLWQFDQAVADLPPAESDRLFADLVPHVIESRRAQGHLQQRLGLLRQVEALRLYAASHAGRWPTSIADAGAPAPIDPASGKPFAYETTGDVARLRSAAPAYALNYEITVRK